MKNLIGMVEFTLEQRNSHKGDVEDFADLVCRYALFLSLKLELWMFVPCKLVDGVWVVLEEPKVEDYHYSAVCSQMYCDDKKEYQQAKERCLFEGFEVGFRISENKVFSAGDLIFDEEETIENLLRYKNKTFILTPTAQKQIGL